VHLAWGALSRARRARAPARTPSPRSARVGRGPRFVTRVSTLSTGIAFVIIFNPRGLRLGQFFTKDESHETALGHGVTGHVPRWPLPCLGDLFPYQFRPARPRPPYSEMSWHVKLVGERVTQYTRIRYGSGDGFLFGKTHIKLLITHKTSHKTFHINHYFTPLLLPIMRGPLGRGFGPGVGVRRGAGGKECVEMSIE
jgi:hypothetical protein